MTDILVMPLSKTSCFTLGHFSTLLGTLEPYPSVRQMFELSICIFSSILYPLSIFHQTFCKEKMKLIFMKALLFVEWITDTVKMMHALKRTMLSKGKKLAWITLFPDSLLTMLQKHSKCEVKAWLYWNLIILLLLRFYVKLDVGVFKRFKNVIFGNFGLLNFDF